MGKDKDVPKQEMKGKNDSKKRNRKHSGASSSDETDDERVKRRKRTSSSLSDSDKSDKEERKLRKIKKKKKENVKYKEGKDSRKESKKKKKKHKRRKCKKLKDSEGNQLEDSTAGRKFIGAIEEKEEPVLITKRSMTPMTKEEYEKQQSVVRRVYDPETGRQRLVKGDGEIMEECVSFARHKEINKQATMGDGASFQRMLGLD